MLRFLRDDLFVRVNLVNRRNRTYVKGTNDVFRAGHIAFTYEPFKTTTIRIEGERGATHRVRADSALAINNVAAAGRGWRRARSAGRRRNEVVSCQSPASNRRPWRRPGTQPRSGGRM